MSEPVVSSEGRPDWTAATLFGAAILLTVLAPIQPATGRALAIDETVSYWIAAPASPRSLFERSLQYAVTPPGPSLLQRATLRLFGDSELAIRLPAMAAAVGAVAAIWLAGSALGGRWTGSLAAAVLAVHPATLRFAIEARPYSLGMMLASVAITLTSQLASGKSSWKSWLAWWAAHAALPHIHYLYVLVWPIALVSMIPSIARGSLSLRRVVIAAASLALSMLPLGAALSRIWELRGQLNWVTEPPALLSFARNLLPLDGARLSSPLSLLVIVSPIWLAVRFGWRPNAWFDVATARPLCRSVCFCAAWSVAPVGGVWLLARYWLPSLATDRYVVVYVPAAALLLAVLIGRCRGRVAGLILLATLGWLTRLDSRVSDAWGGAGGERDLAWRSAATMLAPVQAGDCVLISSGLVETALVPLFHRDATFQDYVTCRLTRMYRPERFRRLSLPMFWSTEVEAEYRKLLGPTVRHDGKVWLVAATDTDILDASARRMTQLLESWGWTQTQREALDGVVFARFERRSATDG